MKRISKVLAAGVTILIVGLAALAAYSFYMERDQTYLSRLFRARSDINAIESAVDKFRAAKGRLPARFDELSESDLWPSKSIPIDPWGHPYNYQPSTDVMGYTVTGAVDSSTQQRTGLTEVSNRTDWEIALRR